MPETPNQEGVRVVGAKEYSDPESLTDYSEVPLLHRGSSGPEQPGHSVQKNEEICGQESMTPRNRILLDEMEHSPQGNYELRS